MTAGRKLHPGCPNASNPYHECAAYCLRKIEDAGKISEDKKGLGSFGRRKKKGMETHPNSPQINGTAKPKLSVKKITKEQNGFQSSSSHSPSDEISSRDSSFDKKLYQSSQATPTNGYVKPGYPEEQSNDCRNFPTNGIISKEEEYTKLHTTATAPTLQFFLLSEDAWGYKRSFSEPSGSLPGSQATDRDDKDDAEPNFSDSDSHVWVGNYYVKSSVSSTLKCILDKHGDIGAGCQLKSSALRAYYLQSLCLVIQELQSTPIMDLTMPKVKEMSAILKDLESAQINVGWLRNVLNQITEALEVISEKYVSEETKASCDTDAEKIKEKIKVQLEELAQKEKEVADIKAQVDETILRLNELQLRSSQAKDTITSLTSKVNTINCKGLIDGLL